MSLTVRDAQYLSWKTFKKLDQAKQGLVFSGSAVDLLKKAEAVVRKTQDPEGSVNKEDLGRSFSELIFILFVLAEQYKISLEDSFLSAIDEIILRSVS